MNALHAAYLEESHEEREGFAVTDLSSLSWVLRKLSVIEGKKVEINDFVNSEIKRLEEYRAKEMSGLEGDEEFFKVLISDYAGRKRAADPKFKSESTPYGKIGYHKQSDKWIYDDKALVQHLEQNELMELVRVTKEPDKNEIKKRFKANDDGRVYDRNGQEVNGITVEFPPDKLVVKAGE